MRDLKDINNRKRIIKAMLEDEEVLRGGIFQKEDYYSKKYNISIEEIGHIEVAIWEFLNGRY